MSKLDSEISSYRFNWFDWLCLRYPPGWLILFNRHWQYYNADPDGWNWLEYLLFLIPAGFYIALALRWLRLGCRAPQPATQPPISNYGAVFQNEILAPISTHHFQANLQVTEAIASERWAIVAMNHAGMCFPWDFLCLAFLLRQQGYRVRALAHPIFFDHPWLVWWLPPGWAETLGGVRAEKVSFESEIAALQLSQPITELILLLYAPEGWRGLTKGWQQRYHLEQFDSSFIRLSWQYQVPIIPTVCIGSERLHPFAINIKPLADWFKMPLFPLSPLIPMFLLFPSMGVWAIPTRLSYYMQPLWKLWEQTQVEINALPRRRVLYQWANDLRSQLQTLIDGLT